MKKLNFLFAKAIIACFTVLSVFTAYTQQVAGCPDPQANNYNSQATVNNGKCQYNAVSYAPVIKVNPLDSLLNETSGLQWAGESLWTFNDGGGAAAIYQIDTISNAILQTVNLTGAKNTDWEDIAFDGTYFYVGDFGNNHDGARTDLTIYKFPLSSIPDYHISATANISAADIQALHFIYLDQGIPDSTSPDHTRYDCEAMIVDQGKIHLFTKNWIDLTSTHYVVDSIFNGTYIALPLDTLNTGYLVTGADKSLGQQVVALLGYQTTFPGNHFMHLLSDYSGGMYFNGNKRKISLGDASVMGQAEGITFRSDLYGYISNEKLVRSSGIFTIKVDPKLKAFDVSAYVSQYVLPLQLTYFTAAAVGEAHKLTWGFSEPVQSLQVQYSTNGVDFTTIKTYTKITAGFMLNTPKAPVNYYRLAWQNDNGPVKYSDTKFIKSRESSKIGNFLLKPSGELLFSISGDTPLFYSFKVISAEGKILATSNQQQYKAGSNSVSFASGFVRGSFVYLSAITNSGNKTTTLMQVK